MDIPCAIIIVTHQSQACLPQCLEALEQQTRAPAQIIIVDSGSPEPPVYKKTFSHSKLTLHLADKNIGFCQGNNVGMTYVKKELSYLLFLNPDAFLTPTFLEQAFDWMERPSAESVAALSGQLLGYDLKQKQPTGRIDSTGIFRTWYGRWYDRGQGEESHSLRYSREEEVPALCGALMFCRLSALRSVELAPEVVMDPSFYMYKEDIDLSLRLRREGWKLMFVPHLVAYHCRGWNQDRTQVPRTMRLLSARNERWLHARSRSPCYLYSLLKYTVVKFFDV